MCTEQWLKHEFAERRAGTEIAAKAGHSCIFHIKLTKEHAL